MGWFERFRKSSAPPAPPASAPAEIVVRVEVTTRAGGGAPPGYISPYITSEQADSLLVPGPDGLPPLHLVHRSGESWLAEDSTGRLVNVANRHLRRLGIWSCRIRGDGYAPGELHIGVVDLVHEMDNPHDLNAVSVRQDGLHVGYFNKGMAAGLAKVLDRGDELQAVGISLDPPKVIATTPEIMEHLVRTMPGFEQLRSEDWPPSD